MKGSRNPKFDCYNPNNAIHGMIGFYRLVSITQENNKYICLPESYTKVLPKAFDTEKEAIDFVIKFDDDHGRFLERYNKIRDRLIPIDDIPF